jgi:hypothetical protein
MSDKCSGREAAPMSSATVAAAAGRSTTMTSHEAFPSSDDLFRLTSVTRLHGLDVKDSAAVCEHFLKFGHFLFGL